MSWWGKVLGGAFGYMLGGPIGAMLGAALGHRFDKGLTSGSAHASARGRVDPERIQMVFFTAVFSVMGHISKADGRVSEHEIAMARSVMRDMSLDRNQSRVAIELFNQGKRTGFDLDEIIDQFRSECHHRRTLFLMFMEILMHAAYADGVLHPREASLLRHINARLGFSVTQFRHIEAMVRAQRFFEDSAEGSAYRRSHGAGEMLAEAYAVLGVNRSASDAEVKKAYRRLMNQHHPDKLVAKGLPEEMIAVATEKTQEIKAAYETVMRHRAA